MPNPYTELEMEGGAPEEEPESFDTSRVFWGRGGYGYKWLTRYSYYRYMNGGYQLCDIPQDTVIDYSTFFDEASDDQSTCGET